jgi:hypothetical protein
MIFTTYQLGAQSNLCFLKNLCKLAEQTGDQVFVIPQTGYDKDDQPPIFPNSKYITKVHNAQQFGVNVELITPFFQAHANPFAGELPSKKYRVIGSVKQWVKSIAGADGAKFLISTGACTEPYFLDKKLHKQQAPHHVLGAVIIDDNGQYRNIRADKNGNFYDLGNFYFNNAVLRTNNNILVCGDWHTGSTDVNARKQVLDIAKACRVDTLFLHDIFDGLSVNHHLETKPLLKPNITLEQEIEMVANELHTLATNYKLYIVKANHDEFLNRYLATGHFEQHNLKLCFELGVQMMNNKDPLAFAVNRTK